MFRFSPCYGIRIAIASTIVALLFSTALLGQSTESVPESAAPAPAAAPAPPPAPAPSLQQERRSDTAAPAPSGSDGAATRPALSRAGASVAIVVDTSHTDSQHRTLLKNTVERFVRRLPEGTEACIFTTSDQPVLLQDSTDNRDELTHATHRLRTGGQPALLAGVRSAAEHLYGTSAEKRAIIVFTPARRVTEPNLEDAIVALRQGSNIEFDAIAGPASDWQLQEQLQRLAVKTGGFALFPPKSGDMTKMAEAAASRLGSNGADVAFGSRGDRPDERARQGYSTVVVRSVAVADNPDTKQFQSGDDELLQKLLIGELQHDKVFPYVLDGRNAAAQASAPAGGGRVLELVTSIVEYRRNNHGSGAKLKVNVMLRDLATGRPVQAFMEKGAGASRMFGGSDEEVEGKALKQVAGNIADEIKKYGRHNDDRENREAKALDKRKNQHEAHRHDKHKDESESQANSYTLPN